MELREEEGTLFNSRKEKAIEKICSASEHWSWFSVTLVFLMMTILANLIASSITFSLFSQGLRQCSSDYQSFELT